MTRENAASNKSEANTPATVEQNLPTEQVDSGAGPQTSESNERKEEQTNYEINSRTISTVKNSYEVERLSVAVVLNQSRIDAMLGENATQADIDGHLAELEQIVASAAGLDTERGDRIKLTVVQFLESELLTESSAADGIGQSINRHAGSMINAGAFVLVALLVIWFGFRPLARALTEANEEEEDALGDLPDFSPAAGAAPGAMPGFGSDFDFDPSEAAAEAGDGMALGSPDADAASPFGDFASPPPDISSRVKEGPEKRLARMVEINEERAAKILRKWALEDAA